MAGVSPNSDYEFLRSNSKNLLILISGASLSSKDFVATELQANFKKLCVGINFYDGPNLNYLTKLKEKNFDPDLCKLIVSLSNYLNLNELMCYDLLCEYLLNDQSSDEFSIKILLSYDRHLEAFTNKVWNYYRWERLYNLLCMKTILAHHRDQKHPYNDLFVEFLQSIDSDDNLEQNLYKQWNTLLNTTINVNKQDSHSKAWMTFLLQEQYELLQIFIVFFKTREFSTKRFVYLLNSFISSGFGLRQINGHLIDDSMKDIVKCIGYSEILILLENLYLHTLTEDKAEIYFLKTDENIWNDVNRTISCMKSQKEHGLILLAWSIVRMSVLEEMDAPGTRALAIASQKLDSFSQLSDLMKCSLFQEDKISVCCYSIVYTFLSKIVSTYDENSLESFELLWNCIGDLLKSPVPAERFWMEGLDNNLGHTVSMFLGKFPTFFNLSLKMLTKLASSSVSSAKKVLSLFQNMQYISVPFNSEMKLEEKLTSFGSCFRLTHDYLTDGLCIRSNTIGTLISDSKGQELIQWQQNINGMQLCKRILTIAIQEISIRPVSTETLNEIVCIIKFIKTLNESAPSFYDDLKPFFEGILIFFQRLIETQNFNKGFLTSIFKLAASVKTKHQILSLWRCIIQSGVLPKNESMVNKWSSEIIISDSGRGSVNCILASVECVSGHYSTLLAFLNLISSYANILVDEDDEYYLSCISYIAREIFPSYSRWWYSNTEQKEKIAQCCLNIFHNILKFPSLCDGLLQRKAQKLVLSSLLHQDTGYALLRIVCIGEEAVQSVIAKQTSWISKCDFGVLYSVKLALSVLNRLLVIWNLGGKEQSPLIQNLCSDPHVARIIMGYVNHRFDSRLATLSVQLLKQFAKILPISLFVCFAGDASSFCRLLLRRLETKVEDVRLKLAILELLEECVKCQPGITETFLGCNIVENTEQNLKQPTSQCLNLVLDILRNFKKEMCYTEELQIRTLSFVKSLWIRRQVLAVNDFKKCSDLWKILVKALFDADLCDSAKADICVILSEECLFKDVDKKSSEELTEALNQSTGNGILLKWMDNIYKKYVYRMDEMQTDVELESCRDETVKENNLFLKSWKTFFIIGTKKGILNTSPEDKKAIFESTIKAVKFLLNNPNSNTLLIVSEVLLYISYNWQRCIPNSDVLCENINSLLSSSLMDSNTVNAISISNLIAVCIKIIFALLKQKTCTLNEEMAGSWIRISCDLLQLSTLSADKNLNESKPNKSATRVVILMSNMMKLLIKLCCKKSVWCNHLQKNSLINTLLAFIVKSIKFKSAADGCCGVLQLLACLNEIPDICDTIIAVGTVQTISMPLTHLQLNSLDVGIKITGKYQQITWNDVYREAIGLITKLLQNKKHLISDIVMDFAGVHLSTFEAIPNILLQSLDVWILDISITVLQFIYELSQYKSLGNLHNNSTLRRLLEITFGIGYVSIAYLLRPRLISHLLGIDDNDKVKEDDQSLYKKFLVPVNDDNLKTSGKLIETFDKLIRLSSLFISIMSSFSPDLCELLADQGYDADQWITLLQTHFNTPSIDCITPPSFGTIISCVTVCLRILTSSADIPASPAQTPISSLSEPPYLYDRELVTCILEKSLYFILSQACLNLLKSQQALWDKEVFKRELGAELMSCIQSRYLKRSSAGLSMSPAIPSPASAISPAPSSRSRISIDRWPFLNLISLLVDSLFK